MIRKIILWSAFLLILVFGSNLTYAKASVVNKNGKTDQLVTLYEQPTTNSKVIAQVEFDQKLIAIYQKDRWLKVANSQNGDVGWINLDQYQKMIPKTVTKDLQTVYIQATTDEKQPDQLKVVVYKNGKQLENQEAQRLYQQFEVQQKKAQEQLIKIQRKMNELFTQTMQGFDDLGQNFKLPFVVILQNPSNSSQ